jgi:16S rRNA (adenine1518-N6/adenine1519-N6)-dimethyltransferase
MRDPDALIRRAGVRGNPHRDQHFLIDDRVLDRLPTYAEPFDTSHVLEIGPGTGGLTDRLLDVADHVTAIERDEHLVEFLQEEFAAELAAGELTVVHGDAVDIEYPAYSTAIANLPYGASSEILFRLLPYRQPLVVTVQREFGERMAADVGSEDYGRLSVTAGHYGSVEIVESVPPTAFQPQPAVDSVVIRVRPTEPEYSVSNDQVFMAVVRAVFTQRRKTLRNAIRNTTHISGLREPEPVIEATPEKHLQARPEELRPREFAELAERAWQLGGITHDC